MNNIRLEIEKAETIPYILSDDVNPSGVFKGNNGKYYFYSVLGTENYNVYLFESTNTIDWTRVGRAQIINPPSNLSNINSLNGAVGFTTATYNGISYVLLIVENAAANISDNNTDYGISNLDVAVLHHCEIDLNNPININYGGRIRFGYTSGGTFVPSYQKMDSKNSLFFDSYKNKWFITGRKRATKTGDIITWHNPSDNNNHVGTGIDNTVQPYTGPATGCEVPTNRRSLNIFEGPTTLTSGVNDFVFSQVLNPEDASFYNYNPKNINSTSHLKYSTIKPDFQWGAAQEYEKRFLINMSTFFKDDRRATINIVNNQLSSTRLNRREGPLQPVILYSRKGINFNLVQEKIQSGTYTGQPDFYKTYLKDEDFASISNVALSTTNYYRNHAPYTTGDNPIPTSEIRQAYPSEFYVDDENLYCTIWSRGYSHYEGGIGAQEPWAHRVRIIKLRKDGFASLKATANNANLKTKLISVDPLISHISVNATGTYSVQLLDENDATIGSLLVNKFGESEVTSESVEMQFVLPTNRNYSQFKLKFNLLTVGSKLFAFRFYKLTSTGEVDDPDVAVIGPAFPAPTLISPTNGATGVARNNATFKCSEVVGATYYNIELGNSTLSDIWNYYFLEVGTGDGSIINNEFVTNIITNLSPNVTYHWRARAGTLINGVYTWGEYSTIRFFTTGA